MMNRMSFSETIFLFVLALVVFGPKKLPEIARQIGKVSERIQAGLERIQGADRAGNRPSGGRKADHSAAEPPAGGNGEPALNVGPVEASASEARLATLQCSPRTSRCSPPPTHLPRRQLRGASDRFRRRGIPRIAGVACLTSGPRNSGGEGEKDPMPTMGFLDHLEELRKRLVYSIIAVIAGTGVCWGYRERIYGVMQKPIVDALRAHHLPEKLVYINPTDPFNLYLKIAMLAGLFLTSPFVLYQVWMFISPGLYRNEKRYVVPFMVSTIALFSLGGYFGYRIAYPRALEFFIDFSGQFQPMITIGEYTSLFLSIVLGMGLIFEMPILVFFLAFLGIMTSEFHDQELPLRDSGHFHSRGHRYAHA